MELELPSEPTPTSAGFVRRTGAFLLREFREILLPTIFFFVGLTPETLAIKDVNSPAEQDAHTKALLAALHKDAGGSALVVEHCNLISDISDIIAALAGPRLPVVCDPVFDHCYCSKQRENPTHQFALWGTKPVCGTDCR
jgi:hypothetical protein